MGGSLARVGPGYATVNRTVYVITRTENLFLTDAQFILLRIRIVTPTCVVWVVFAPNTFRGVEFSHKQDIRGVIFREIPPFQELLNLQDPREGDVQWRSNWVAWVDNIQGPQRERERGGERGEREREREREREGEREGERERDTKKEEKKKTKKKLKNRKEEKGRKEKRKQNFSNTRTGAPTRYILMCLSI